MFGLTLGTFKRKQRNLDKNMDEDGQEDSHVRMDRNAYSTPTVLFILIRYDAAKQA